MLKTGHFGETLYAVATPDQRERPKEEEKEESWSYEHSKLNVPFFGKCP